MADIIINDITPRVQYVASSGQTTFIYNFPIYAASDLKVYKTLAGQEADDTTDILALTTNYTVTGVGTATGGTVILNVGAVVNDIITIIRDMPTERTFDYITGGDITASELNTDLDKDVLMAQQNKMKFDKVSPHYQNSAIIAIKDLKLPLLEANQFWAMNNDATKIQAITIEFDLDLSTFIAELADESMGTDGARLVGYYDSVFGGMTLKEKLDIVQDVLPVADTTAIVHDPATPTKRMRIDVGAVSAATTRTLIMPDADVDLGAIQNPFQTGNMIASFTPLKAGGWMLYENGTIGSAASGATIRANADVEALYVLLWDEVSNTFAPVIGGRGASAAADFAANKQLTLPRIAGRAVGSYGEGYAIGEWAGAYTHTMSLNEMPDHEHILAGVGISAPETGHGQVIQTDLPERTETLSVVGHSGTTTPFSIVQPVLMVYWLIKL
jgi:hypothetical protein